LFTPVPEGPYGGVEGPSGGPSKNLGSWRNPSGGPSEFFGSWRGPSGGETPPTPTFPGVYGTLDESIT